MQHLHMIIAVDRAGFVGEDGISHQGILDAAFLNGIPGITVYSPSTYTELKHAFIRAIYHSNGVVAIRYPRGTEKPVPESNDLSLNRLRFTAEKTRIRSLSHMADFIPMPALRQMSL